MHKPFLTVLGVLLSLFPPAILAGNPTDVLFESGFEGPGRIEFITDQSALVTGAGQSFDFEVRVFDANEVEIPDATVQWYLYDDSVLSLEALGDRTARVMSTGFELGNVGIRVVSFKAGAQAEGQVIFADLKASVFSFSSDQVTSVDRSAAPDGPFTVVLPRNSTTETIAVGDVVISGDRAGLLDRVLSADLGPTEVTLTTELASLEDAFENLSYTASTLAVQGSSEYPDALPPESQVLQSIDSTDCKTENNSDAGLTTTGASVTFTHGLQVEVSVSIVGGSLQSFEFGPKASAKVTGETGSLQWSSQVAGEVTCALELTTFETPPLPVHMFSFQLGVTPEIGIKAGVSFNGPSFTIRGPKGAASGGVRGGIAWAPGGWSTYGSADWLGSFDPFEADFDTDIEFELTAKPYGALGFTAIANLGRPPLGLSLAEVGFADVEGGVPGELSLASPFDTLDPGYAGPSWMIAAKLEGNLKAELSGGALQSLLNTLSIPTSIDLDDATLWDPVEIELAASPTATLSADCQPNCQLNPTVPDSTVLMLVVNDSANASGQVSFLTSHDGATPLTEVANDSINGGSGSATWEPVLADLGSHSIYGRYSIDLLSQAFPYAVTDPLVIVVAESCDGEIICPGATIVNENDGEVEKIALAFDGASSCTVATGNPNLDDDDDFMIRLDTDPVDGATWDDNGTSSNWSRSPVDFGQNLPSGTYSATMTRAGSGDQFELEFSVSLIVHSATAVEMTLSDASVCPIIAP
jgi:hypothetical protein